MKRHRERSPAGDLAREVVFGLIVVGFAFALIAGFLAVMAAMIVEAMR